MKGYDYCLVETIKHTDNEDILALCGGFKRDSKQLIIMIPLKKTALYIQNIYYLQLLHDKNCIYYLQQHARAFVFNWPSELCCL